MDSFIDGLDCTPGCGKDQFLRRVREQVPSFLLKRAKGCHYSWLASVPEQLKKAKTLLTTGPEKLEYQKEICSK